MQALTKDHKPAEESEQRRIVAAGGQIYQTATPIPPNMRSAGFGSDVLVGPYRVLPGRLSVSRTFGDAEAKLPQCGGNPNVVIATPDIISFKIADDHDFIVMGSDGIFDRLSNKDVVQCGWIGVGQEKASNVHQQCGVASDAVIKNALLRRSLDNVTSVVIAFANFRRRTFPEEDAEPKAQQTSRVSAVGENGRSVLARNKSAHREAPGLSSKFGQTTALRRSDLAGTTRGQQQPCVSFLNRIVPQSTRETKRRFDFSKLTADCKKHA
ncbi:MAG: PP2C family protein-serine/threonine phosphatase [Acidobacteriaceae bacterium]|nr:PP2C family protein-serine/threonine phosphatase [Acidobacteriaceae bacterium]